jgi:hypothetical protein
MSLLDDVSGVVNSATTSVSNLVKDAGSLLDSGPASALTAVTGAVGGVLGGIGGALGGVGTLLKQLGSNVTLPIPNPLFAYASYNYVLGLSAMPYADYNSPDTTYMKSKTYPLIAKTANIDPSNRIKTSYGQFDFFIENLEIESVIGFQKNKNTNTAKVTFEVREPYSMGMFMMSCQIAVQQANNGKPVNWLTAPYLLTIDFRGNTETGKMANISGTSRKIPVLIKIINSKIDSNGTIYYCTGVPYNQAALSTAVANIPVDHSVRGVTVQEILQYGEKSLQATLNKKAQQKVIDGLVTYPDEYIITFPKKGAYSGQKGGASTGTSSSATVAGSSTEAVYTTIGVFKNDETYGLAVQRTVDSNPIGQAKMPFNVDRKGDIPNGKEIDLYDTKGNYWKRGLNTINYDASNFQFRQDSDIMNAINQIVLLSMYPTKVTLDATKLSPEGYKTLWRIHTKVFIKDTDIDPKTGDKPRIYVYEITEYDVGSSSTTVPNLQPYGLDALKKHAVKQYNYIYTGKNVDILKFDIELNASYYTKMPATSYADTMDSKTQAQQSASTEKVTTPVGIGKGATPEQTAPATPTMVRPASTETTTARKGGSTNESRETTAARQFFDIVTTGVEQTKLNMEIIGDPYYIAQSGNGNYVSQATSYHNLNADGTVNWQNGEVDILINFRTPIDINQGTGLYNFGSGTQGAPVIHFSGLYRVIKLVNHFKDGKFTQVLEGVRRTGQENKKKATQTDSFNVSAKPIDPKDPAGYNGPDGTSAGS